MERGVVGGDLLVLLLLLRLLVAASLAAIASAGVAADAFFDSFRSYGEIEAFLRSVTNENSYHADLVDVGTSSENRTLYAVRIGWGVDGNNVVVVAAGFMGREWMSVAAALRLVQVMATTAHRLPLELLDIVVVPLVNPDGYVQTFDDPTARYNRKNRNTKGCSSTKCGRKVRCGVDIFSNFPPTWRPKSRNFCSPRFPGLKAGSEPETRALINFFTRYRRFIKVFVGLHHFGGKVVYASCVKGDKDHRRPDKTVWKLARAVAGAMTLLSLPSSQMRYENGECREVFGSSWGTPIDFVASLGIEHAYMIVLRRSASDPVGYSAPSSEITSIANESIAALKMMTEFAYLKFRPPADVVKKVLTARALYRKDNEDVKNAQGARTAAGPMAVFFVATATALKRTAL